MHNSVTTLLGCRRFVAFSRKILSLLRNNSYVLFELAEVPVITAEQIDRCTEISNSIFRATSLTLATEFRSPFICRGCFEF